ncbi:hypothetical protein BV210_04885 [Halorientalis sp. IM1011]|nr:hypothetical protein BV210_04885 [Halorientalis sp. IM1011]
MKSASLCEIGLVSCVKSKRDEPAVPKELYTSAYFRLSSPVRACHVSLFASLCGEPRPLRSLHGPPHPVSLSGYGMGRWSV